MTGASATTRISSAITPTPKAPRGLRFAKVFMLAAHVALSRIVPSNAEVDCVSVKSLTAATYP